MMCVSRCLRCVGISLVPTATICMLANVLLLLPDLKVHFLLEGHITREATWATGLWGSGIVVLLGARGFIRSSQETGCCVFRSQMIVQAASSSACLLAAAFCFLVSGTGLVQGPLCLHRDGDTYQWGVPLKPTADQDSGYLYNRTLWWGVCVEPRGVVLWNLVLFSVMAASSGLQVLLCLGNIFNSLLGLLLGRGLRPNKVGPLPA